MDRYQQAPLRYSILDPTGNITALVESPVEPGLQPAAAAALMARHPQVEQVGFVDFPASGGPVHGTLRMAGGEFCGNASLSAAALYLLRRRQEAPPAPAPSGREALPETVRLRVSGAAEPVEARLRRESDRRFRGGIRMPPALAVEETDLSFASARGRLPLVRMEGISHLILEPGSAFWRLKEDRAAAGQAVRTWCHACGADGLGLMFLEKTGSGYRLTPLVFIPGSGTVFWENSCASGSSAAGMYLSAGSGGPVDLTLEEPGGRLRVTSDPVRGETWLYGETRLTEEGSFSPPAAR